MQTLHYIQQQILKELLTKGHLRFSELNTIGLTNDHFTFHLKQLIKLGYIKKEDDFYALTTEGLEYANRIDTTTGMMYRQPKLSVSLGVLRENEGKTEVLLQVRTRNQSVGKLAWFTEKVLFNESIYETAARCLKDETGLSGEFQFAGTTHVIRKSNKEVEIDIVLIEFKVINFKGELKEESDQGLNRWFEIDEAIQMPNTLVGFEERVKAFKNNDVIFQEFID